MARLRRSKQDKELLDRLQQDSWQLELILTGFVILGLFAGLEAIDNWASRLSRANPSGGQSLFFLFPVFVYFAYVITLVNLLIHVLIRGLWIGAVGLRSVSGDIDYQKLNLQPRFLNFLRRRTPSFDNYIFLLEEAASLMFAFTFLLIMMLGSAFLFFSFIALPLGLINSLVPAGNWRRTLLLLVFFPTFFSGILYFLDFILMGRIKRIRWLSSWYYPVYRLLGFVTLAFVYRPIYYNFIDNRIGRRALRLAMPYLAALFLVATIRYDGADYWLGSYERNEERSALFESYLYIDFYDDLRQEAKDLDVISIPSLRIDGPLLPVFLEYLPRYDEVIRMKCPDLPADDAFVIRSSPFASGPTPEEWGNTEERIACLQAPFSLFLDDEELDLRDGLLTQKPESRARGTQYFIPIDSLSRGLHTLELRVYERRQRRNAPDTIRLNERIFVPFYRE